MQAHDEKERQVGWVKNWQRLWNEKLLFLWQWAENGVNYITLPTINWNIPVVLSFKYMEEATFRVENCVWCFAFLRGLQKPRKENFRSASDLREIIRMTMRN